MHFELDALIHLHDNQMNVAYPIPTKKNNHIVSLNAPEGVRYAILTTYINGDEIDLLNPENITLYALHMAKLHQASTSFTSDYKRFTLDTNHLITEPLKRIKPFLINRENDWLFITNYAHILTKKLQTAFDHSLDIGLCHGDLHGGNAHIDGSKISSFDFDCCGIGLRVYDLAVFKWGMLQANQQDDTWQNFLQSYQQQRPLAADDLNIIDTLVSIRQIWLMGLHIEIALAKGWLNDRYFDQKIKFLREQQKINNDKQ